MSDVFELALPGRIVFGAGALERAGTLARELGSRAIVVTGKDPARAAPLLAALGSAGIEHATVCIGAEPTTEDARRGLARAAEVSADLVLAMGGGSALDAGKAIAMLLVNGGDPLDYLEVIGKGRAITRPSAPFIAIPTTAGTGSEATRNAVLESPEHRVKVSLRAHSMLPSVALVDPLLTLSVPPDVTASTGFDALAQVIEPFVCNRPNPMVDALCREAIPRAARSLRRAYEHGDDRAAREDMAWVSLSGGIALANARLGAVHGFAGPIGGMFKSPHGATCAALLPHVMAENVRALRERAPGSPVLARYDAIAGWLTGRPEARAEDGIAWVSELAAQLGIPKLARYGLGPEAFEDVIDKSRRSSSMKGNPIELGPGELRQVIARATRDHA